jgi:hypothetical protein
VKAAVHCENDAPMCDVSAVPNGVAAAESYDADAVPNTTARRNKAYHNKSRRQ